MPKHESSHASPCQCHLPLDTCLTFPVEVVAPVRTFLGRSSTFPADLRNMKIFSRVAFGVYCWGVVGIASSSHITNVKSRILQELGFRDPADYTRYDIVWPQHTFPSRQKRSRSFHPVRNVLLQMNLFGKELAASLEPKNLTSVHFNSLHWSGTGNSVTGQGNFECHYRGSVQLCEDGVCSEGKTAFSSCSEEGLRGFVMIDGDDVEIRPFPRYFGSSIREALGGYLAIRMEPLDMWDDLRQLMDEPEPIKVQLVPSTWKFVTRSGVFYGFPFGSDANSQKTSSFSADVDFDSDELALEIGVFVDQPMTRKLKKEYSSNEDETNAVLSAFNAVQVLYDDVSFGNVRIRITVKTVIFDEEGKFKGDGEAEKYLTDFCTRFQDELGVTADWDVSIALTGTDVYGVLSNILMDKVYAGLGFKDNKIYGVTGLSYTGGVCKAHRNCVLSEFSKGMSNVDTIAHEIGHVLGMNHDGDGNTCPSTAGKLMSLSSSKRRVGWSTCSIKTFTDFLRNGKGDCLQHVS